MVVNEVAQWLAVVAILILTLGVYRQVGMMLVGSRGMIEGTFGPSLGEEAPPKVRQLFQHDLPPDPARRRVLIFVREHCPLCEGVLDVVAELERREQTALSERLAVVVDGRDDYRYTVAERLPTIVVETLPRTFPGEDPPGGYPFALQLDDDFRVAGKELGGNVISLLANDAPVIIGSRADEADTLRTVQEAGR